MLPPELEQIDGFPSVSGRLRFAGQSSLDDQPGILARPRAVRPEEMRPMTSVPIQGEAKAPSKFWVLLTASLVSSLIMLDSNIVAVSLPAIGRSLGASFTDMQWVISAYVLTYASLLLASGGYADLRGRKKSMLIGLVIFAVASATCSLATDSLMLKSFPCCPRCGRRVPGILSDVARARFVAVASKTGLAADAARQAAARRDVR
jgi:Major Facilitator Superfamily